jgi:FkbH-like protein
MTYLATLKMEVDLHRSNAARAARVHELSNKTNQFNLALQRLSRAQSDEAFGKDHLTMTVHVRDALSDSGLVGVLIARFEGAVATVREVLFSCRVLGREIETLALARFARWLAECGARTVRFEVVEGPRNQPARDWLARVMPQGSADELAALIARLEEIRRTHPATVQEHTWN